MYVREGTGMRLQVQVCMVNKEDVFQADELPNC